MQGEIDRHGCSFRAYDFSAKRSDDLRHSARALRLSISGATVSSLKPSAIRTATFRVAITGIVLAMMLRAGEGAALAGCITG